MYVCFLSTFRLSDLTLKITSILKITHHVPVNMAPFGKEDKILIRSLYKL